MNVTVNPSVPMGEIRAISSKSAAHRMLICAAFASSDSVIRCENINKDIEATADCLRALGADIRYENPYFKVTPIQSPVSGAVLPCGESGSTLRFLLPVVCALGVEASFVLEGRLPERPLSPLYGELVSHGAVLSPEGSNPLYVSGCLDGREYRIRGDVSSQFISGLLFALTLSGKGGKLIVEGKTESEPYIDMTTNALALFGACPQKTDYGYFVPANARLTPSQKQVEGDWSNAAFPLCMGAIGGGEVTVSGLDVNSRQGDRAVVDILRNFGAEVTVNEDKVTVKDCGRLCGIHIDATQIPDLVPVLATVAAVARGQTVITGASRLRIKESDRLMTTKQMLTALGADVTQTDDGLVICGKERLRGGTVDGFNDHRIALSAAVAAVACDCPVTVRGAECVAKSYPDFWSDIKHNLKIQNDF